jgi:hypothetical protein
MLAFSLLALRKLSGGLRPDASLQMLFALWCALQVFTPNVTQVSQQPKKVAAMQ